MVIRMGGRLLDCFFGGRLISRLLLACLFLCLSPLASAEVYPTQGEAYQACVNDSALVDAFAASQGNGNWYARPFTCKPETINGEPYRYVCKGPGGASCGTVSGYTGHLFSEYSWSSKCSILPWVTLQGSFDALNLPDTFCYKGCEYSSDTGSGSWITGPPTGNVCETDTPLGGDGSGGGDDNGGGNGDIENPGDGDGDDGGSTGGGPGTGGGDTGGGGDSGGGSAEVPGDSGGSGSGNGSGNNGGNGNGDGGGDGAGDGSGHDYSGVLDAILNKLTEIGDWLSGTDTGEADTEDDGIGPSSFWKNSESDDFILDTSGFGYSRSCPKNPTFSFRGKTYTFDVMPICSIFIACGYVVVILASLWAVRVMVRD